MWKGARFFHPQFFRHGFFTRIFTLVFFGLFFSPSFFSPCIFPIEFSSPKCFPHQAICSPVFYNHVFSTSGLFPLSIREFSTPFFSPSCFRHRYFLFRRFLLGCFPQYISFLLNFFTHRFFCSLRFFIPVFFTHKNPGYVGQLTIFGTVNFVKAILIKKCQAIMFHVSYAGIFAQEKEIMITAPPTQLSKKIQPQSDLRGSVVEASSTSTYLQFNT